ncbi:MAG: T9SS type A sorting domain-containing protein [Bacteroidota bacterium]
MKRFTLILLTMLLPVLATAQFSTPKPALIDNQYIDKSNPASSVKADGEIFWSTTFDFRDETNPVGWSWPAGWLNRDENDLGNVWAWNDDSLSARFTHLAGLASHTPEDGWIQLFSDGYNYRDNVSTSQGMNAWFQLPPIDCSSKSSVIVKFYQNFRTCCSGSYILKLQVTNDDGVHWADYNCKYGTNVNDWCLRNEAELNITEVAAGLPSVLLRFVYSESTHYFWAIDDLTLSEGYHNELVLEDDRSYMNNTIEDDEEGFMPYLPLKLINGTAFGTHTFWGAFYNNGIDDQEAVALKVDITKNGEGVFSATSAHSDIWTLERDTVDFTESPFQPDGYGDYHFTYTAISNNSEQVPANNQAEYWLTVDDSIYSRCDDVKEDNQSTAGWAGGGNSDGDILGVIYTLTQPMEVNSLSVLITRRLDAPGAGTRPGMECQYWIYKDMGEDGWAPVISSSVLTIEEKHLENWITLNLEKDGESEFLQPGNYIAGIQTWHGGGLHADNGVYRFSIGYDMTYYTASKSVMLWIESESWGNPGRLNMIRMNFNETGAPALGSVIFNVDMNVQIAKGSMNPDTDFVDVTGSFNNWGGSAHMTDADGDGVYTLTLTDVPTFREIEYKYRINGNAAIAEFPNGANRKAMVRFYTILDDVYNNGKSVLSVPVDPLASRVTIYPNPASGNVNISILNAKPTDTDVVITSLHGQVVYRTRLRSVIDYTLPVDLSGLARGLYLVKVNDTVTKIIVD